MLTESLGILFGVKRNEGRRLNERLYKCISDFEFLQSRARDNDFGEEIIQTVILEKGFRK